MRGKIIILSFPSFSVVLDHPVAYEFPVLALYNRFSSALLSCALPWEDFGSKCMPLLSCAEMLHVGLGINLYSLLGKSNLTLFKVYFKLAFGDYYVTQNEFY